MNDVLGAKTIGFGHFCIASLATSKQPAFMREIRACGTMYGAVDSTATKQ